jgi:hypothetical protein
MRQRVATTIAPIINQYKLNPQYQQQRKFHLKLTQFHSQQFKLLPISRPRQRTNRRQFSTNSSSDKNAADTNAPDGIVAEATLKEAEANAAKTTTTTTTAAAAASVTKAYPWLPAFLVPVLVPFSCSSCPDCLYAICCRPNSTCSILLILEQFQAT